MSEATTSQQPTKPEDEKQELVSTLKYLYNSLIQ